MKKKVLVFALILSMLLGLTACKGSDSPTQPPSSDAGETASVETPAASGSSAETEGEKDGALDFSGITLNIAHSTTGEVGDALQAQFDAFEELTGCKIEVEPVSYTHLDVYKRQPFFLPPDFGRPKICAVNEEGRNEFLRPAEN